MSAFNDRRLIDRFIHTLPLRNPESVTVYRCILRHFQRFVVEESDHSLSRDIIRRWLDARRRDLPMHVVYHRARLVDRFLDWLVMSRAIPCNPFAEWRREYGQRTTTPIVRALLSPHVDIALEALRPLPPFGSSLGQILQAHIARMRALGYRYDTDSARLLRFDRFLQGRPDLTGQPLRVLIQAWADAGSGVHHVWEAQVCGRVISTALHRLDPTTDLLRVDRQLYRQVRQQHRRPYICTVENLRRILDAARTFPSPLAPLRPLSLHLMVILAACAGLRLGELARLTLGNVDLDDGTIEILETKFFKSRRLPLAPSVIAVLRDYLDARRRAGAPMDASAGLFWHQQRAGRYSRVMIEKLLVRVLRRAGLKPVRGRAGPRVHDLRHAFVVHRMLTWYRAGTNPQSRLPYLATYLGHKDINSTLVYLTITQELLQQASERFRQHSHRVLHGHGGGHV
jgi:integrase/recombinase XerD